jgi:hypothetical protein
MKMRIAASAFAALIMATSVALAFSFGVGHVNAWRSDNTTTIHYWVTGADGTGTPALTCRITTPSGAVLTLKETGSAWDENGDSHAYFLCNGYESGTYTAVCSWDIDGYGSLDGTHAVASTTFRR